jgi:hypothetical protein
VGETTFLNNCAAIVKSISIDLIVTIRCSDTSTYMHCMTGGRETRCLTRVGVGVKVDARKKKKHTRFVISAWKQSLKTINRST